MEARASNINFLEDYRDADSLGRVEIIFGNFRVFPKIICKMEKMIEYEIQTEREYIRSHNRGELGVRVQTSTISNPTANEAEANVCVEEFLKTGNADIGILGKIENAEKYEEDIRIISAMKRDYELIAGFVEYLDDEDSQIMKAYLVQRKYIKEMACEFNLSYDTVKRRIKALKQAIKDDAMNCMEKDFR